MSEEKRKQRVLVVDDQRKVLRFIEICLKLRGFEVICATSGQEAIELAKLAEPDIMLLDIIMPGMDGFEVLRKLRAFTELPVIAFSSNSGNQDKAIRLGANNFITKPFNPDEMIRKIETILSC